MFPPAMVDGQPDPATGTRSRPVAKGSPKLAVQQLFFRAPKKQPGEPRGGVGGGAGRRLWAKVLRR